MKLACTSVMLPRWNLDETFDKLAAYGYSGIELRCRYNPDDPNATPSFWGRHLSDISPDNIIDKAPEIRAAAARSAINVIAIAPKCLLGEDEHIEKIFKGAIAIDPNDPPMIRLGALAHDRTQAYMPQFLAARSGLARWSEIARQYGIKLLYEIHVGTVAVTCSRAAELLRDLDPQCIGAIYDIPNMLRVGLEDTRMGMEILGPYLAHCHIGNGIPRTDGRGPTGNMQWKWDFTGLREGIANIPQIVEDFKAINYQGYLSLEDFGPGEDDIKVRDQGTYLKSL